MNKIKGLETVKSYIKHMFYPIFRMGNVPIWTHLWVTRKCNLKCGYCYVHNNNFPEMNTEDMLSAIYHIKNVMKCNFVAFMGGEPLVRKDIMQLISYATSLNMNTLLTTNGTLLNDSKIIDLCMAGLDALEISLDGMKHNEISEKTGDKLLSKIEKVVKLQEQYDIELSINMVITKQNYNELDDIVNFIKDKRISLTLGLYIPDITNKNNILNDKLAFTSVDDLIILNNIVLRIMMYKYEGIFIAHPNNYFDKWVKFMLNLLDYDKGLKIDKLWTCDTGKNFLEVDCDGKVRYCSYLNSNIPSESSIFETTPKFYQQHKMEFKQMLNKCNSVCLANCFFQASEINRRPLTFFKEVVYRHLKHSLVDSPKLNDFSMLEENKEVIIVE